MKRTILMVAMLLGMGFLLAGCNEPDRWHEKNPSHGEESRKKSNDAW